MGHPSARDSSRNGQPTVPNAPLRTIEIDNVRLAYRSDWDLLGVIENFVLDVYRHDVLRPGSIVLDIGAGIGDFSVLASMRVGPSGRVIAVEPNPHDYRTLVSNLERNHCSNVSALNLAISASGGVETFSFKDEVFSATVKTASEVLEGAGVTRVDFVKMDAEGSESVILPASVALLESAHYLSIELHGNQEPILELLSQLGYSGDALRSTPAMRKLALFILRHPLLSIQLFHRIGRLPEYRPSEIVRRLTTGLDIARPGSLSVALFRKGG